jgi:hypothetical protein
MQLQSTTKVKKTKVYLTFKQKWDIASWCIEHRNIIQDIDPKVPLEKDKFYPYVIWRVAITTSAKELNAARHTDIPYLSFDITAPQLTACIEFFNEMCEITNRFPVPIITPIQDTVQMDQLTAANKRLEKDIIEISDSYTKLSNANKELRDKLRTAEVNLKAISKLIPAYIFTAKI